jgi:hypothetical protein
VQHLLQYAFCFGFPLLLPLPLQARLTTEKNINDHPTCLSGTISMSLITTVVGKTCDLAVKKSQREDVRGLLELPERKCDGQHVIVRARVSTDLVCTGQMVTFVSRTLVVLISDCGVWG